MALVLGQDSQLEKFGNDLFTKLKYNKVDDLLELRLNRDDLNNIKFSKKVSDEKKEAFFNDLLSDERGKQQTQTAAQDFQEQISASKINPSKLKVTGIVENLREVRNMNISIGEIVISYMIGNEAKEVSVSVIKINNQYRLDKIVLY